MENRTSAMKSTANQEMTEIEEEDLLQNLFKQFDKAISEVSDFYNDFCERLCRQGKKEAEQVLQIYVQMVHGYLFGESLESLDVFAKNFPIKDPEIDSIVQVINSIETQEAIQAYRTSEILGNYGVTLEELADSFVDELEKTSPLAKAIEKNTIYREPQFPTTWSPYKSWPETEKAEEFQRKIALKKIHKEVPSNKTLEGFLDFSKRKIAFENAESKLSAREKAAMTAWGLRRTAITLEEEAPLVASFILYAPEVLEEKDVLKMLRFIANPNFLKKREEITKMVKEKLEEGLEILHRTAEIKLEDWTPGFRKALEKKNEGKIEKIRKITTQAMINVMLQNRGILKESIEEIGDELPNKNELKKTLEKFEEELAKAKENGQGITFSRPKPVITTTIRQKSPYTH